MATKRKSAAQRLKQRLNPTLRMCLQEQWEDVSYLIRLIDSHDDWGIFDKDEAKKFVALREKYSAVRVNR